MEGKNFHQRKEGRRNEKNHFCRKKGNAFLESKKKGAVFISTFLGPYWAKIRKKLNLLVILARQWHSKKKVAHVIHNELK